MLGFNTAGTSREQQQEGRFCPSSWSHCIQDAGTRLVAGRDTSRNNECHTHHIPSLHGEMDAQVAHNFHVGSSAIAAVVFLFYQVRTHKISYISSYWKSFKNETKARMTSWWQRRTSRESFPFLCDLPVCCTANTCLRLKCSISFLKSLSCASNQGNIKCSF